MSHYEYFDASKLRLGSGDMFIEIIPISFGVTLNKGASLSQLRLFNGKPEESMIKERDFIKSILHGSADGEGFLTVDISNTKINNEEAAAFCACNKSAENLYIDICETDDRNKPCPSSYWRFVKSEDNKHLKLENGKFYLLRSKERIELPSGIAVYAKAMDETLGEMRIHYAGFVHPFFGKNRLDQKTGTPLIFEVRAHNVDVTLCDGERLAKLNFYRMSENAKEPSSEDREKNKDQEKYNNQELLLSKHFKDWPTDIALDHEGCVLPTDVASEVK